jgi:hypothetical protein
VKADGALELRGIVPGTYDLVATSAYTVQVSGPAVRQVTTRLLAHLPIEAGGADIENVTLTLRPGFNVTGRIAIEGRPGNANYPDISGMRVQLLREPNIPQISPQPARVAPNGTFNLTGIVPGEYRLRVTSQTLKTYTKMARLGAIDILKSGLRIEGDPQAQLEILLSPNPGTLDAIVFADNQQPAQNVTVVLVPDFSQRGDFELYRSASTDAAGRAHIDGIVPGDYKIFAWEEVDPGAWQYADFLRIYEDRGKPVQVFEGSKETVDLRAITRK